MKYKELGYTLPKVSAQKAADRAIAVLEDIAKTDGACLFYVIQASNILALAGLRAQSPYNEFPPSFSKSNQAVLEKLLHENGYGILYENDNPYEDDRRNTFLIMCNEALLELPKSYASIRKFWKAPKKLGDMSDFTLWSLYFQTSLVRMMEDGELPKEWLQYWWAPHHIRFGMLLGYPGEAIAADLYAAVADVKGKQLAYLDAAEIIPFQGVYSGSNVSYYYAKELKDSSVIKEHTTLWTDVLTEVYAVFPESRLMEIPGFKDEYDRYKKYDEGWVDKITQ